MTVLNNPCLLQTIIICSAVVIVIMIVPFIIMVCKHDSDKRTLFGLYVFLTSIVLLIGISMFSFHFKECSKVLEFISLLSAIVSIILAVLTIVYSYYTSGASVRNIENVQKSAKELNNTAQKLDDLSKEIDEDSKKLGKNIDRILMCLDNIETHTKQITDYIDASTEHTSKENINIGDFDNLLNNCPNMAIMFLYACGRVQHNQDIKVDKLFDGPAPFNMMYFMGLAATFKMLGLIELQIFTDKFIVRVGRIDVSLSKAVEHKVNSMSNIDSFIKDMKEKIDYHFKE